MTYSLDRLMLILLATTALSGCVSPSYPIVQASPPAAMTPAPRDVAMAETAPVREAGPRMAVIEPPPLATAPAAVVETRPLADLAPANPPPVNPPPAAVLRPSLAAAAPAMPAAEAGRPSASRNRTATTRSVTGKVVGVEAPGRSYTVRKGDTLEKIARKLDTEILQLAKDNGLKKPYRLQPGRTLKGPPVTAKAYVVGDGDTLFAISRRFGVSVDALRDENGLRRNASLSPGRKLRLPSGFRDRGPIVAALRAEDVEAVEEAAPATSHARKPIKASAEEPSMPAAVETETVVSRSITGRVVTIEGPATRYKVRKGDNLEKVARKLDTEVDDLARDNHLKKPYRLRPGQTLKGPTSSAKAYVVGREDTLSGIARRFGVSEAALRQANGLRRGAGAAPGRKLRLPAGYRDRCAITTTTRVMVEPPRERPARDVAPQAAPPSEMPPRAKPPRELPAVRQPLATSPPTPSTPQPYTPSGRPYTPPRTLTPSGMVNGAPVATPPPSDAQVAQMGRGVFAWPLRGEILSGFGGHGAGPRNDGLNIRANTGDAVRAAASGDVVYAGDQVPGFGNLVLIKHADGWVTAYGHLSHVDVRMQQKVTQGQQIGQAGSTGGVSEPQLHFEVRFAPNPQERARPVDPSLVLPR